MKYTMFYSLKEYFWGIKETTSYISENVGKEVLFNNEKFNVFLEIGIFDCDNVIKKGDVEFKIIFKASKISTDSLIKNTKKTIPFFIGLPGFCRKKFMVNERKGIFSGIYEWESYEDANRYSKSYALNSMKRMSNPYPVYIEIVSKSSGKILKKQVINF